MNLFDDGCGIVSCPACGEHLCACSSPNSFVALWQQAHREKHPDGAAVHERYVELAVEHLEAS